MSCVYFNRCATCQYDISEIMYLLKNKEIELIDLDKYLKRTCCMINFKGQYRTTKIYGVPMNIAIIRKGSDIRPIQY